MTLFSTKRTMIAGAITALLILNGASRAKADDLADIKREVAKRHDEAVKRLQDWIALPSIAAENRNYPLVPSTWPNWRVRPASSR